MVAALLALALQDAPSFSRDVAPLLFKHCAPCHRPGEIGPFPLLTHADAAKRAKHLAEQVASGLMPPWKAEPQPLAFAEERRLSDAERRIFARWAETGAKEGDPALLPPLPKFAEGWTLGEPDLVLEMKKPFGVPATGRDAYQSFVLPIPIDSDRMLSAIEFRPGNPKVVHHATLLLDGLGRLRKRDPDGDGYSDSSQLPTGALTGWVPGMTPQFLPDGYGIPLKKGNDLVLQIHYHPSGKAETDRSRVGFYFAKKPVEKIVLPLAVLPADGLDLPAGENRRRVLAESAPMPADARVLSVAPHMHFLGREFRAWVEKPDGSSEQLLRIGDWDFNWQSAYSYRTPPRLPKGSVVKIEAIFDNSSENPQNPNAPPKRVRWGDRTSDEMLLFALRISAERPEDSGKLYALGLRSAAILANLMLFPPRATSD